MEAGSSGTCHLPANRLGYRKGTLKCPMPVDVAGCPTDPCGWRVLFLCRFSLGWPCLSVCLQTTSCFAICLRGLSLKIGSQESRHSILFHLYPGCVLVQPFSVELMSWFPFPFLEKAPCCNMDEGWGLPHIPLRKQDWSLVVDLPEQVCLWAPPGATVRHPPCHSATHYCTIHSAL